MSESIIFLGFVIAKRSISTDWPEYLVCIYDMIWTFLLRFMITFASIHTISMGDQLADHYRRVLRWSAEGSTHTPNLLAILSWHCHYHTFDCLTNVFISFSFFLYITLILYQSSSFFQATKKKTIHVSLSKYSEPDRIVLILNCTLQSRIGKQFYLEHSFCYYF